MTIDCGFPGNHTAGYVLLFQLLLTRLVIPKLGGSCQNLTFNYMAMLSHSRRLKALSYVRALVSLHLLGHPISYFI